MKVLILTIRDKKTKELIYVEGTQGHIEYVSSFSLNPKWLTEKDINSSKCWYFSDYRQGYSFDEEVRHLVDRTHDLIQFAVEEIEVK